MVPTEHFLHRVSIPEAAGACIRTASTSGCRWTLQLLELPAIRVMFVLHPYVTMLLAACQAIRLQTCN